MNIHKKTPLGRKRVSPHGQQMTYTLPDRRICGASRSWLKTKEVSPVHPCQDRRADYRLKMAMGLCDSDRSFYISARLLQVGGHAGRMARAIQGCRTVSISSLSFRRRPESSGL